MSSFKLPSFSFSGSKDDAGKNDEHDDGDGDRGERKSRSLFSSLTGGGSSNSKSGSSSSLRSPSPYAGRSKYSKDSSKSSGRHHHRPWKRHSRKESHSDVEYAGATSSANVSEAESDGEGVLSRLASNSSSGTTSSSKSNSNTLAPLTSSTSATSNTSSVSFADTTPSSSASSSTARSGNNRSARFSASSSGPQGGRGAPRNAYYDDDSDEEDEEHRRATAGGSSKKTSTNDNAAALSSTSDRSGSSAPSPPRIRGIRTVDPTTSDSENEEAYHEEYAHTSGTDEEEDYYSNDDDDLDPTVAANTEANAGSLTAAELLSSKPALLAGYGDDDPDAYYYNDEEEGPQENWPNLVKSPASPFAPLTSTRSAPGEGGVAANRNISSTLSSGANTPPGTTRNGRGRGGTIKSEIPLIASRPIYERNRCSITLTHGDPDSYVQVPGNVSLLESGSSLPVSSDSDSSNNNAQDRSNLTAQGTRKKRKGKTYVVASDLSEESYYAIEWAIGTVLRSGDELLFVTVMETDSKRESSFHCR